MSALWHIVADEKLQELRQEASCERLVHVAVEPQAGPARRGCGVATSPPWARCCWPSAQDRTRRDS